MITGSLQVKNGKYYAVLNLKDKNNKRKQKWISTGLVEKGNKRKAEEFLQKCIQQYSSYGDVYDAHALFCDYILNWVEARTNIENTTRDGYRHMIKKHIYSYFKEKKLVLCKMKPADINAYYKLKKEEGLSCGTIENHHQVIHACLQDACNNDLIAKNIADLVEKPKQDENEYEYSFYELDDLKKLFKLAKEQKLNIDTVILLSAYYGLRRSEVLGLTWDCIDFEKNTLAIKQKVVRVKDEEGHLGVEFKNKLKTPKSKAIYPLIPVIKKHLQELKLKQEDNERLLGNAYVKSSFICIWNDGRLFSPDYVSDKFSKFIKQNNMKHIRFHDLRHSCGSLLLDIGFSMKQIQEWLRHSNYQTTANIYAHNVHNTKNSIVDKLEELLPVQDVAC